jgi:TolB-like protein/Tfp pilus assembly protein PilF
VIISEFTITAETVQAQLERILKSPDFDASKRNRRFLQYVVEQSLAGHTQNIKAYSIATLVFGREAKFDPQADPIIRIEASRLRRSLERYYLTAGRADPIRIDIPKGSYIPTFGGNDLDLLLARPQGMVNDEADSAVLPPQASGSTTVSLSPAPRQPLRMLLIAVPAILLIACLGVAWLASRSLFADIGQPTPVTSRGPAILVAPFNNDSADLASENLVRGFTREVVVGLTQFSSLFVFGTETSLRYGSEANALHPSVVPHLDFIVTGGVMVEGSSLRVTVSLVDFKTGRHIWGDSLDGRLTYNDIIEVRKSIAARVVQVLAQPYGVIYREEARKIEGTPPQLFTSYECVLKFYQYWQALDVKLHGTVRTCLEKAIVDDPRYSEAFSALAMVYANTYRYGFERDKTAVDPLPKALELAKQAADLAPESVQSYKALHLVYWLTKDVDKSFEAGRLGLAVSPNDSEMMADLGGRMCLFGEWEQGYPLVEEAYARNPAQPGLYRIVTFFHYYLDGEYEAALAEAQKADIPSVIHAHVILAMAYAQLGRQAEAKAEIAEVLKIDPQYGASVIDDLQKRSLHPDIVHAVVLGLQKAGLDVSKAIASQEAQSSLN